MTTSTGFDTRTKYMTWRVCAWGGPGFLIGLLVFWALLGKFVPPPPQYWTADEVMAHFLNDNIQIRIGMVGTLFFGPFLLLWSTVISRILARIEGPDGVLSTVELIGGIMTSVVIMLFGVVWLTASFRTEMRAPQDIQLLQDVGWFLFDMTFIVTLFQLFAFGGTVLLDRSASPLFPRWLGWFALFSAVTFLPELVMPFLMKGPFAWHGLISFYVAIGPFFPWAVITCFYVFKAINRLEQEELARTTSR